MSSQSKKLTIQTIHMNILLLELEAKMFSFRSTNIYFLNLPINFPNLYVNGTCSIFVDRLTGDNYLSLSLSLY